MIVGMVSRRSAVAFLISLAYWFFEMTTKGDYTGIFHLFSRTAFVCGTGPTIACIGTATTFPWVASKWLLVGASACLLAFSVWLLEHVGKGLPHR
jgi:hypothetical protein